MSDNVKVSIKVRPLIKREKESKLTSQWRIRDNTISSITGNGDSFVFDHIFDETVSTRALFDTVCRPVILAALNGINGTIFAYGQTSSGKTYTMIGDDCEPGVVPLTAREIFEQIKKIKERQFLIRVGFIEIYNEKIHDLLNTANTNMKIVENQCGDVVVNSKECITNCPEQIIQYVDDGNKARKIGETNMNERSSRSHTIIRITIESRLIDGETDNEAVQIGILNLVDLAGSERADQTGATGSRFKEGVFINRSLLSLSCVIQKLSETSDNHFINYRDSKLTRILQASLGGNAVTSMICNITPAAVEETYYTLSFAMRAKKVRNKPEVNEILTDAAMMKRLEREIKRLQQQLRSEQNKNSKIKLVELQDAITLRTNQFINSNQMHTANTENARRRTWCPSTTEIPRLHGGHHHARPLSGAGEGRTLMGPPSSTTGQYLVSMNGMTPNIAIRTPSPDEHDPARPEAGFGATLALIDGDAHQGGGRANSPVGNGLLNPFITDGDEFTPGEQISFGLISLSPLSSMARDLHTPKSLRPLHRSSTGDSPTDVDYRQRCREVEQELIELQEFTRLEKKELADRDESLVDLRGDIEEKEHRLEQLDERCTLLELELKEQQARVSKAEDQLAQAVKERQAAVREAEHQSNTLTGIEFAYESFRQRSEAREKELIESLQEARGSAGSGAPSNGDNFRLDQKREEMKRLEMQNYDFSLQLEECNKQIEQLKSSYLEQQRKLEQVKQTVLEHPPPTVGGSKGENSHTQSLVQSLRRLLLAREDAEHDVPQLQNGAVHEASSADIFAGDRTVGPDANVTTIGDDQAVQELLKIIAALEQEKTAVAESNGAVVGELQCRLEAKIATVEQLERQLEGWKEKYVAQTSEYDELSTQLMDQMQDSEDLRKELDALRLQQGTVEARLVREMEVLRETLDKVTGEKAELERVRETLREETGTLQKAIEEQVTLVGTLEKEREELSAKYDQVSKSLDVATAQAAGLNVEVEELKERLQNQAHAQEAMDKALKQLVAQESDLKCSIDTERAEKAALAEENGRLSDRLEEVLQKQLDQANVSDHQQANPQALESVHREREEFEQKLKALEGELNSCKLELEAAETDRASQVQHFSQEKQSFERATGELRLEVDRLQDSLRQLLDEKNASLEGARREAEAHMEQERAERLALVAELDAARQGQHTQEKRMSELHAEVNGYRSGLETIQQEYTALVEKERTDREMYEAAQTKFAEEIGSSQRTIDRLREQIVDLTGQEASGREELEKQQLAQTAMEKRIAELEQEVQRQVELLEAARLDLTALAGKQAEERETYARLEQNQSDEMETARKTIERLTEERENFAKRQSGDSEQEESLAKQVEALQKCTETLERQLQEKDERIGQHEVALETARNEQRALAEQQNEFRNAHEATQQKLVDERDLLKSHVDRLRGEKEDLQREQTEGSVRQQALEKKLGELCLCKGELSRQVVEREEEIMKYITELDTLRAEQLRLVEQQNGTRKALEARNATLEGELEALQQTVDQLMTENGSLLKEQLEHDAFQRDADELDRARCCRDELERLVAQLERDLATVRSELEVVRRELLEEKRRQDAAEQAERVRVEALAAENERLQGSIDALEDEKRRLLEAEGRLVVQLEENNRRSAELEARQQETETFREELRRENSDLTVAVQELSAKLVSLEEQMDGNEAVQRKTIDTLAREKQLLEDAAQRHEQEAAGLRQRHEQEAAALRQQLSDLRERHERVEGDLRDVRTALEESSALRARLEADLAEASSVRAVLERELGELKSSAEGSPNGSKQAQERYEQERQLSANLRRALDEKQMELESFMATGRPSLGDGRVAQALRRENEDLLRQLTEYRQIDALKGRQLQERVDELQRLETEIERLRDEMGTMRHESSFTEKEVQITQLRQKVTEVEKVREETVHQKRSLERAYDQLRFKNQTLAKEVDELRRTTDKERKSRRQSTHDDRRGLLFNSKEATTMTDPSSTDCSCLAMDAQIKELRNKLTHKDCQLNTQKLISAANPLKTEITEMRRKLEEHNREKAQLERELRDVLAELDRERKERRRHCTQCIRHARQQYARCDKAVQAYHPGEPVGATTAAVSVSIVSTSRTDTPGKAANGGGGGEAELLTTAAALQARCDEQQQQYERLMGKYQMLKQLCRLRNEKIVSLGQEIEEMENDSTNMHRMQKECVKLKQQLKEAEHRCAQSNRSNHSNRWKADDQV